MRLGLEEVRHIAALCRIEMTDEEAERLRTQLSNILEQFEILKQVDTENVPPTGHSVLLESVMRRDASADSAPREEILANAPVREEGFFRVKAVLEE